MPSREIGPRLRSGRKNSKILYFFDCAQLASGACDTGVTVAHHSSQTVMRVHCKLHRPIAYTAT